MVDFIFVDFHNRQLTSSPSLFTKKTVTEENTPWGSYMGDEVNWRFNVAKFDGGELQ